MVIIYSTAQSSTVQYSTVQYSTVQYSPINLTSRGFISLYLFTVQDITVQSHYSYWKGYSSLVIYVQYRPVQ